MKIYQLTIRTISTILFLLVRIQVLMGQSGNYLVSKHKPSIEHQNSYFSAATNSNGTIYLASRNGLIKYDGDRDILINTGGSVFDVKLDENEQTFLATSIGLIRVENGIQMISLMPPGENSSVHQVLVTKNGVYGLGTDAVYFRENGSDSTTVFRTDLSGRLYNLYELEERIYVNSENKGTLEVINGALVSDVPEFMEREVIVYTSKNASGKYILGTINGELHTYENGKTSRVIISQPSFTESEPMSGLWYSDEIVVIGTMNSGVFFLNVNSGKIESIVDYNSGLDDNEVVSLTQNKNKGISAIGRYAISHILPDVPVRNYEYYEGVSGDVLSVLHNNGSLYVGTNLGLFRLNKITDYEEEVSYINRRKKVGKPVLSSNPKRGFFGFKKKKKANKESVTEENETLITEKTVIKKATGVHYVYKEINENISHVSHLRSSYDGIIVGGLTGVFEVVDDNSKLITTSDCRYLYLSLDEKMLFVSTGSQELLVFMSIGDEWVFRDVFTDFRAQIDHIREFGGSYWMSSPEKIYKISISHNELDDVEEYALENPYYSNIYSTLVSNELNFISASGSFIIKEDSIISLKDAYPVDDVIIDNQNEPWVFSGQDWIRPSQYESKSPVLKAFDDLKAITYDVESSLYWIVSENSEILQFSEKATISSSYYTPYMEGIRSNMAILNEDKLSVIQDESKLSFEISHADLPNIFNTKYRYRLQGMDKEWSSWSTYSTIEFPFLPSGTYTLLIEAKNGFGEDYKIESVSFEVLPPYWKRPLFYLFEFGVVLSLFLLSITLRSWGYKYRILSRLLAFLTLVIIIEYMEAVMESYFLLEKSPVFGFALQVLMAMIILPFEGVLKKYVLKENISLKTYLESKGKKDFSEKS
jgi:hypothetical protein